MKDVRVSPDAVAPGEELARLEALDAGAVASFTGLVRRDDGVSALTLEHYPGMTEPRAAIGMTRLRPVPFLSIV